MTTTSDTTAAPFSEIPIRHESAKLTASQTGSPLAGWFSYQPIYDKVLERDPSFLN